MVELRSKGIVFHDYDMPDLKTVDGVVEQEGERGAWFDDSEGNILSIAQPTSVSLDQARQMLAGASA